MMEQPLAVAGVLERLLGAYEQHFHALGGHALQRTADAHCR